MAFVNHHNRNQNNVTISQQQSTFRPVTKVIQVDALGHNLPPLVITYTNEHDTIVQWLTDYVVTSSAAVHFLGLDTETKPCFTKQAAQASRGPDTLQLAKADGTCLVVHLSRMERPRANRKKATPKRCSGSQQEASKKQEKVQITGFQLLSKILSTTTVAKAGVSIDDDAIELHKNHFLDTNCRMDLSHIHYQLEDYKMKREGSTHSSINDNTPTATPPKSPSPKKRKGGPKTQNEESTVTRRQPLGLKYLAEQHVPGLVLPKKKKLQMSNWQCQLSNAQIGYAAADAFAGAAILGHIVESNKKSKGDGGRCNLTSLIDMVVADEVDVHLLEDHRKRKRMERKRRQERVRKRKKTA